MKILKIILVFITLTVSLSCSKDGSQQPESPKTSTVYVGGSQKINGKEKATIWKNGVAELLNTDLVNASRVNSVLVSGNDVMQLVSRLF